jgi:hypothetical protein
MTRFWTLCSHKKGINILFSLEIVNEYKFRKEHVNSIGVIYEGRSVYNASYFYVLICNF